MTAPLLFLPGVRSRLVALAEAPAAGETRRRIRLRVGIRANGTDQPDPRELVASLLGAGDVTGMVTAMIAGVEPASASRAVEPNYFPYVDFADADFPWRYSLHAGATRRCPTWIALVALEPSEFTFLDARIGPLPAIEVRDPRACLPDLAHSWAFGHTQIDASDLPANASAAEVQAFLTARPDRHHSRLLCTRRLRDSSAYFLFLVPTYEAGRRTGMGEEGAPNPWNAAAWIPSTGGPLRLPYYAQWSFRTSTLEDFESLARRLQPHQASGSPVGGTRTAFVGQPGYFADFGDPTLAAELEGALRSPTFVRAAPIIQRTALTPRLEATLTEAVKSEVALPAALADPEADDPLLSLPVYGRTFAEPAEIRAAAPQPAWVHEVNLDLRLRLGAGVGSRIVKRHQEEFMQICWAQVGEIQEANRRRARLAAAAELSERLVTRHLLPLPAEAALRLAAPLFDLLAAPAAPGRSVTAELDRQGIAIGALQPPMRRLAAKRPVRGMAGRAPGRTLVQNPPAPGVDIRATSSAAPSATVLGAARRRHLTAFTAARTGSELLALVPEPFAATETFTGFSVPVAEVGTIVPAAIVSEATRLLAALPLRKASRQLQGLRDAELETLDPIMRPPRVLSPLSSYVGEESLQFLIPNLEALGDNRCACFVENRAMIAAIFVGANAEMARELRWREFPTDMRGTVLGRFWPRPLAGPDESDDDVLPLHTWAGAIDAHFRGGPGPTIALVIRGDLVRRYPGLLAACNRQTIPAGGQWKRDRGTTTPTSWALRLGADAIAFGFDISADVIRAALGEFVFLLYEPTGRPRFGLDIATYAVRQARRNLVRAPVGFPLAALDPGRRAARIFPAAVLGEVPTPVGPVPATTDDLSWEQMQLLPSGYIDFGRAVAIGDGSDVWGPSRDGGSIARATIQKPVCAVVPARKMMT